MTEGLARVRKRFVEELGPRRNSLVLLRDEVEETATPDEIIMSIGHISHKIAGTAATVGFAKLGGVAAELDDCIGRQKEGGAMPRNELFGLLEDLIALSDHILDAKDL